jgi:hypothetical protein
MVYNSPLNSISNGDDKCLDEKGHWPVPSGSADRLYVVHLKKHKNYVSSHPGVSIKDNPCNRCKTTIVYDYFNYLQTSIKKNNSYYNII